MNGLPLGWYIAGWVAFVADTLSEVWRKVRG